MDPAIAGVLAAHRECLRIQHEQEGAAARRDELVRAALKADVPAIALADALGVNRQRIYAMARPRT